MKERVAKEVDLRKEKILALSHYLYENPEIGLKEYKASKKIAEVLREEGFEVEENLCGMPTAFIGRKKNGSGPRIAFIAEYDALPGMGHACGHNLISAMSVGAALSLAALLDNYQGEVIVVGTPSEETGDGKPYLIEKGAFKDVDTAMMIHPANMTCTSPEVLAIGGLDFNFYGKASHAGACPHEGVNALDAVILLFNNINALRQQLKDDVRIHGIIREAGDAPNIIPSRGKVRLEIRAKEQDYFNEVVEKVINCAKAAELATGTKLEWSHFEPTCESMTTNKKLAEIFQEQLKDFGIEEDKNYLLGSTDMGNLSHVIPIVHAMLKVYEGKEGPHTTEFLKAVVSPFGEERAIIGAKLLALTGFKLLENPELISAMKEDK